MLGVIFLFSVHRSYMDVAFCTIDGKEWIAQDFFDLGEAVYTKLRRNLKCPSCEGDAWFRKASYGNKVPHFCAHHVDGCGYATTYEQIGEGDGGNEFPAANPDSGIILDLGLEKDYSIDVKQQDPNDIDPQGQHRVATKVENGGGKDFPAHMTLKNLLYKLVRSDKLYFSESKVFIPNSPVQGLPEIAKDLFVNFKDINENLKDKNRIFWGFISDAGYTADGKLWLNAGSRNDGLSVSINPEIAEEFRRYFKVEGSLDNLAGCHVLVIGNCYFAASGKPVIWCGQLDYIVLRRYKSDLGIS